jgi:hypothetical protein
MGPEGALSCSQIPTTELYPEPVQTNSALHTILFSNPLYCPHLHSYVSAVIFSPKIV